MHFIVPLYCIRRAYPLHLQPFCVAPALTGRKKKNQCYLFEQNLCSLFKFHDLTLSSSLYCCGAYQKQAESVVTFCIFLLVVQGGGPHPSDQSDTAAADGIWSSQTASGPTPSGLSPQSAGCPCSVPYASLLTRRCWDWAEWCSGQ